MLAHVSIVQRFGFLLHLSQQPKSQHHSCDVVTLFEVICHLEKRVPKRSGSQIPIVIVVRDQNQDFGAVCCCDTWNGLLLR